MERLQQQHNQKMQQRQLASKGELHSIFPTARQGRGSSSPEKQNFPTPSHNLSGFSSLGAGRMSNIMMTRCSNAMQAHRRQEQLELVQLQHQSELMQLQSTNESSGNNSRMLKSNKQLQYEKMPLNTSKPNYQAMLQWQGRQQQHESLSPNKKQKALRFENYI